MLKRAHWNPDEVPSILIIIQMESLQYWDIWTSMDHLAIQEYPYLGLKKWGAYQTHKLHPIH